MGNGLIVRIGFIVGTVTAAPSEYWSHAPPAVRHARKHVEKEERAAAYPRRDRGLRLQSRQSFNQSNSSDWQKFKDLDCGQLSDEKLLGTMWWTANGCSLASRDLTYVYVDEETHEKWGQWAMGQDGN